MKKNLLSACVVGFLVTFAASTLQAVPIGNLSAGRKYYLAARDLSLWSMGLSTRGGQREAKVDNLPEDIEFTYVQGYVGYDFIPWFTAYVKIGSAAVNLDGTGDDSYSPQFGFGMRVNILEHDIMDPTLFEDRILINAGWEYTMTEATRNDDEQTFSEFYACATLSIVNDVVGDKYYLPFGIGIFLGPCYSLVETSNTSVEDDYGFVAGLEVFYTKRISFFAAMEQFGSDSSSSTVGMHVCL